jgi:hypothetical protein
MSCTYSTFVTMLAAELAIPETDTDFVAILPQIIEYSEQRCYRELGLLTAVVTTAGTLTANDRSFTLPTTNGHPLVLDYINVLDGSAVRHQAMPATRDLVETLWPSNTAAGASTIPEIFARIDDATVLLGPPPGSAWSCEVIHTIRPTALSVSNTTTYLSTYLCDLFFAGAMVSAAGWMRNYGAQADDPRMAVSWETQFQTLMASARAEEAAKKFVAAMSTGAA